MVRTTLWAGCAVVALTGTAHATVVATASLYAPWTVSGAATVVDVSGVAATSNSTIVQPGYSITFSTYAGQGVVHGSASGNYALPVAGTFNGSLTYLTGGYGSAQTTDPNASGNYLSTGVGSIAITFSTAETSLALLWGSVDTYNSLNFLDAHGNVLDTLTGSSVQSLAHNFASDGFQGANGSAYVTATDSTPFTTVQFVSTAPSFEFAGVVATTGTFSVPEPVSLSLFASGLFMAGLARRRRRPAMG